MKCKRKCCLTCVTVFEVFFDFFPPSTGLHAKNRRGEGPENEVWSRSWATEGLWATKGDRHVVYQRGINAFFVFLQIQRERVVPGLSNSPGIAIWM